jgi:hypothetical protein
MTKIKIWEYSTDYNWHQVYSNYNMETKDETQFFRVIRRDKKEFYHSSNDYIIHNKIYSKIVDVNDNKIN